MSWIRENWYWIVVGVMFIWMHTRRHGGHRGRGGGCVVTWSLGLFSGVSFAVRVLDRAEFKASARWDAQLGNDE